MHWIQDPGSLAGPASLSPCSIAGRAAIRRMCAGVCYSLLGLLLIACARGWLYFYGYGAVLSPHLERTHCRHRPLLFFTFAALLLPCGAVLLPYFDCQAVLHFFSRSRVDAFVSIVVIIIIPGIIIITALDVIL